MKRSGLFLLLAVLLGSGAFAAEKVLTANDRVSLWAKDVSKEFKKVKSKDAYVTYPDFTDRVFDSLDASGLQTGGTIFPTLSADLQAALTRFKTDINTLRDTRAAVKKTLDDLAKDLRVVANGTTPAPLDVSSRLILSCYNAVADGEVTDRERITINALALVVTSTSGLSAQTITDINTHVAAVNAVRGISKTDLMLLTDDLKAIATITK